MGNATEAVIKSDSVFLNSARHNIRAVPVLELAQQLCWLEVLVCVRYIARLQTQLIVYMT